MISAIGFSKEKEHILENFYKNTLNHSIIISGQKGIGKSTLVFDIISNIFQKLLPENQIKNHLNLLLSNSHMNIRYLVKEYDNKNQKFKSSISVNQIRDLQNFLFESSLNKDLPKIVIIDSADDLNINSSNSLLKILEEPKSNTFIFLITHNLSFLLPTIRSRCLKIKLKPHNFELFKKILNKNIETLNDEHLKFLYDLSNGSPGIAEKINDSDITNLYDKIIQSLSEKNPLCETNIYFSNEISQYDDEKFKNFLSILKFILLNLSKINSNINIFDYYLSKKIKNLVSLSNKDSNKNLLKKLNYLIANERDLFKFNFDKKVFIQNFFAVTGSI